MVNILHEALSYLNEGYSCIPCDPQTKRPLVRWSTYQQRKPTENEWGDWFLKWRNCNLGLVTGYFHNRVVLDFDTDSEYFIWLEQGPLIAKDTLTIRTGRGYHVHYETSQAPGRSFIAKLPDNSASVEVKARGSFVIVPPSVHTSGQVYRVVSARHTPTTIKKIGDVLGVFEFQKPKQLELPVTQPSNGAGGKIDAIKAAFRVEQFIKESTGKPDSRGRVAAKCPLPGHDDNHTSFWFHPGEQVCACAKCTGAGTWDVINLYAEMHSLTNRAAIYELYQLTPQGLKDK